MEAIKVFTKVEIMEALGISEAEFRHAKEALKFQASEKSGNNLLYSQMVVDAIAKHRSDIKSICKGATLDMFSGKKQPLTIDDLKDILGKINQRLQSIEDYIKYHC